MTARFRVEIEQTSNRPVTYRAVIFEWDGVQNVNGGVEFWSKCDEYEGDLESVQMQATEYCRGRN